MRRPPRLAWITDGERFGGDLCERAASLARGGVDAVQLRESRLCDREIVELGRSLARALAGSPARLLVNDRFDLALACGAQGVHLKSDGLAASRVRALVAERRAGGAEDFLVGKACHSAAEIATAADDGGADYVTLSPLREKPGARALGFAGFGRELERARETTGGSLPAWLALGGLRASDVGPLRELAAPGESWGLAAIRLFQEPVSEPDAEDLAAGLARALQSPS